ncbi:MAG: methyl-accepting chemotaxis protein [Planctomycetes bacterium]|nr:methyl-accepting chemotaxis protein [Planctomycetota bacterium]
MYGIMFRVCVVLTLLSSVMLPTQADELADLAKRVAALEGDFKSLDAVVNDNASQIGKLTELLGQAVGELTDQGNRQREIIDQITATDDNGEVYLTLNSIMNKSTKAREEVREAVERSIRKQGTLSIENKMGTVQDILVNRVQYHVHAGATLNLTVPVGTVSTQLPGQKIVNWTIGVPNYRQSISIKPRYTAARVSSVSSTWVSQPIYYETPIYYNDPWWGGYVIYR